MPYAEGRTFLDADSHLMELPEWLPSYAEPAFRGRIKPYSLGSTGTNDRVRTMIERGTRRAGVPSERPGHEAELLTRKSWDAYGAFHAEDRSRALDLLGYEQQLVFSTFAPGQAEFAKDLDLSYAAARALTRGMIDFCARDSQCHSGKCEKGICTCDANKDCPGSLRCVNRIGKNFCVPPGGSALGAYCQKNSDCGPGTCNNNLCGCSTDAECKGLVSGSPRCAKPLGQRNFCQPTSVALAAACERDSDCTSGKCRKDLCVP